MAPDLVPRLVGARLAALLAELPAVLLTGPRASGKTTLALVHAGSVLRLDTAGDAALARADPDALLRTGPDPVLVDEWQQVPDVVGAIKRAVDTDGRAGRFIVTGSVRAGRSGELWPATGRIVRIDLHGLAMREQLRTDLARPPLLDLVGDVGADVALPADVPDIRGYVELALRGTFPEPALRLSSSDTRRAWFDSYAEQLVTQDVALIAGARVRGPLRAYLDAMAATTGTSAQATTLASAAGIDMATASAYERLLVDLGVAEVVPAWWTNRLKRLTRGPKRSVADPALAAAVLGVDADDVLRDGDLLGRLLETFVAAQVRPELALMRRGPRLLHLRTDGGRREVDFVVERRGGSVVGVEVKATAAPSPADARHLVWLQEQLGPQFECGVVLHTGPRAFSLAPDIHAIPICALWA